MVVDRFGNFYGATVHGGTDDDGCVYKFTPYAHSPVALRQTSSASLGFQCLSEEGEMKLSVEAKVASAVAAGFLAVTVSVMAQGNSAGQPGAPNHSSATSDLACVGTSTTREMTRTDKKSGHQNELK